MNKRLPYFVQWRTRQGHLRVKRFRTARQHRAWCRKRGLTRRGGGR